LAAEGALLFALQSLSYLQQESAVSSHSHVILGNVVRAGRRDEVAIPSLESLYGLMKMVEIKNATPRP
jgi:2-dehydropantoate 2-reductase